VSIELKNNNYFLDFLLWKDNSRNKTTTLNSLLSIINQTDEALQFVFSRILFDIVL